MLSRSHVLAGASACAARQLHHSRDYAAVSPKPKVQEGAADVEARGLALLLQTGVRGTLVGVQAPMRLGRKKTREIQGGREGGGRETRVSGG